jgi:GNAT superfamily N-acetyltransferase
MGAVSARGPFDGPRAAYKTAPVLRDAHPADAPLLKSLAQAIWPVAFADVITQQQVDFMIDWMYAPELIERELAYGVRWRVVEDADQKAIGYTSTGLVEPGVAKLHKIYLLPSHWGRGIGKDLVADSEALAAGLGAAELRLCTNRRNWRQINFYFRCGFTIRRLIDEDIGDGFQMNDFEMTKAVASVR